MDFSHFWGAKRHSLIENIVKNEVGIELGLLTILPFFIL